MKISACLIVKDEERHLDRCLSSLQGIVDEIVVVDTGSTDGTLEIAQSHGAVIGSFDWCDDFSAARNASLDLATGDWVLWIDADEALTPESASSIRPS
jgi:glycosyltransferase involved in cell wall biosynthesis